jgi:hypothetical protein
VNQWQQVLKAKNWLHLQGYLPQCRFFFYLFPYRHLILQFHIIHTDVMFKKNADGNGRSTCSYFNS